MRPALTITIATAAMELAAPVAPARAGACDHEIVAPIRMSGAQACWIYRGAGTTFVGQFGYGQRISAQMSGQATDYDPRAGKSSTSLRPRDPNVEGPGGFFFSEAEAPGTLTFVVPANGTYRFRFSPCAMWGATGTVKICAR